MAMTKAQLLDEVKTTLNITGDYSDGSLNNYINEVKAFLADIDVPASILDSEAIVGIVSLGVDSLRETGGLSEYFKQRAIQLRLKPADTPEPPKPTPTKMVRLCGITENASYAQDYPFVEPEENGIFQYGDRYFIKFSQMLISKTRDIPANSQIQVAKIDDETYYPVTDLLMTGYCTIGNEILSALFRLWPGGMISVLTPAIIPQGKDFIPDISAEYSGVRV